MPLDDLIGASRSLRQRLALQAITTAAAVWGDASVFGMASWQPAPKMVDTLSPEDHAEIDRSQKATMLRIQRWGQDRANRQAML